LGLENLLLTTGITAKEQQWWRKHGVSQSLSYGLGASLLREADDTKLQEMPDIYTRKRSINIDVLQLKYFSTVVEISNLLSDCMMNCTQKLLFVLCGKQMTLLSWRWWQCTRDSQALR
jgi:hypothetical protein